MFCTASPWECSCRDNAGLYIVSFWQLCFGSKHTHTTVHGWAFIVKGASPCCTGLKQLPVVHVASVVKVFWAALIRLVITGQGSHSKLFCTSNGIAVSGNETGLWGNRSRHNVINSVGKQSHFAYRNHCQLDSLPALNLCRCHENAIHEGWQLVYICRIVCTFTCTNESWLHDSHMSIKVTYSSVQRIEGLLVTSWSMTWLF